MLFLLCIVLANIFWLQLEDATMEQNSSFLKAPHNKGIPDLTTPLTNPG
jgi:hypothetical protein